MNKKVQLKNFIMKIIMIVLYRLNIIFQVIILLISCLIGELEMLEVSRHSQIQK